MAPSKWRFWRILARAKAKGVDLILNAAIERAPLNSLKVRKSFFFLLVLQRFFIAVKLETYDFEPKGTFKKSKILQLFGKFFVRRRKLRRIRDNASAQRSSKLWLPDLASLQLFIEYGWFPHDMEFFQQMGFQVSRPSRRRDIVMVDGFGIAMIPMTLSVLYHLVSVVPHTPTDPTPSTFYSTSGSWDAGRSQDLGGGQDARAYSSVAVSTSGERNEKALAAAYNQLLSG